MPVCYIQTNVPTADLPGDLHTKFSKAVAEVLTKPEERISVTLHGGLHMCRGGSNDPIVQIQIWSIGVFGKDKNPEYGKKLREFIQQHLPHIPENRIVILLLPIEPHDVVLA